MSKREALREIKALFSKGDILYYSAVSKKLNLRLQLVVEICDELEKKGEKAVVGDVLDVLK